jgi:predicted alpha/beta-fold hydrolase
MSCISRVIPFIPHSLIRNPHAMTLAPRWWPRHGLLRGIPTEPRLFTVAPNTRILGYCHWHHEPKRSPTLILIHGLEGCSESHYMRGIATKAWLAGFNAIRINQRNCGGMEHETPTLYHSGLSGDLLAVATELADKDGLDRLWFTGYSMGGNLVLRMAGEMSASFPPFQGAMAVCPNIDPAACVTALEKRSNWIYHRHFLRSMQARLQRKAALFPGRFDVTGLSSIRSLRAFDDAYTAPDGGFLNAADYYERVGARHVLERIAVPTLILTAQDDPFIPYRIFSTPALGRNSSIHFIAPQHGGHCGFLQRPRLGEDVFWAENRLIEFMKGRVCA